MGFYEAIGVIEFKRLRRSIATETASSDTVAVVVTTVDAAIYVAALTGFCTTSGPLRWLELAVASIMAGLLFIVGHDACHRALARSRWLNVVIAHLAFIPTLHPQTAWARGHHWRHHGFTNLRGVDYVWTPWSPREYATAGVVRRFFYRFYRTAFGIGFYYPIEIWWPHAWHSDTLDRSYAGNRQIATDKLLTLIGFASIFVSCLALGVSRGQTWLVAAINATAAVAVPLIFSLMLMSVVIFMHHTHPSVRWFASKETYDPLIAQMQDTVHVRFPMPIELLYHQIFQHTAHHLNPRIPLYRLGRAQRLLENAQGPQIITESFSLTYFLRLLRECQLYDYDAHRWLKIDDAFDPAGASQTARRSSATS